MLTKLPWQKRWNHSLFWATMVAVATIGSQGLAQRLVSNPEAARLGLERAWFAQVRVDPARHQVVHWLLDNNQLFALTSSGTIQSIDSETGKTLWTTEVGDGNSPAVGVAVNAEYVALLDAGRIYLMDRKDGRHLWSRQVGGATSAAPALSENYAYVVLLSGRVEGYRLDDSKANVWQYQSHGRTFQSPTTTGEVVSWPSDRGMLYVGAAENPRVLFRVETDDEIVAPPAERQPLIYVGSLDGYLYCFHELTGGEQWRYATGFAITSQPAIVGDKAYVASEGPSLHAVNALTGQPLWHLDGATQFVALGQQHTYSMDRYGTLIVIDNESGGVAGRLAASEDGSALVNHQTDRIFLTHAGGLVQCLHEIGADQPTWHRKAAPAEDADATEAESAVEGTDEAPDAAVPVEPADATDSPFEAEAPTAEVEGFGDFGEDPNPFE